MQLKTQAEIAKLANSNKMAVNRFIAKHKIPPAGKKGKLLTYDADAEPLAGYVRAKKEGPPVREPEGEPIAGKEENELPAQKPPKNRASIEQARQAISKPLNDILKGKMPQGSRPAAVLFGQALKMAGANQDAVLYTKLAQIAAKEDADEKIQIQMIKTEQAREQIALEKAAALKLENDIRRERYVELEKIKLIMGRIFAVHTSILQPLSLKLGAALAAVPEGGEKERTLREMIDKEIYASLESIKRLLADYITEGGG